VNRDGCFAEYLCLPSSNLLIVPDALSTDHATFTEPLAAALEIQQQVQIRPGDRVLVVGDGKLGLLVAQTLALTGCDLVAVGRHIEKLALLAARGIRTVTADAIAADTIAADHLEMGSFDLAVEVTGNADGFALARRALRPHGTLILKSTYAGDLTLDASSLVVDEITLIGSRCGPFAPALRLLAEKRVDVASMIADRYALTEGLQAFKHAGRRGALKVLLDVS
jgi:threonine dehydrogenase-like Zn-dependent dehydrogenase